MKRHQGLFTLSISMVLVTILGSCHKDTVLIPPTVKVFDGAITVNYTNAVVSAEVTDQGDAEVSSRGFVYGRSGSTPDTVFCGSGKGVYSAELPNLLPNTSYTYEAFARNAGGMGTSGKVTFTTLEQRVPVVRTLEVVEETTTTAICYGRVVEDGGSAVTKRGMCWSKGPHPSIDDSHAESSGGTGEFQCELTGLEANTKYYVRAYATNGTGTGYGEELSFTKQNVTAPTVTTSQVSNITHTTAKGGGNVTSAGNVTVTERGICWGTSHNPTTSGSHAASGTGTGSFTVNMTNLSPNTKYYVRAYAKNSAGTAYGSEVSFTTQQYVTEPKVTTSQVTSVTQTTAKGGGNVTSAGNGTVTERGICWGTSHNPTTSGSHAASGTGTGSFTVNMTNLSPNTKYYVRAYAKNSAGTAYGTEVSFTTLQQVNLPTVTTSQVTSVTQTTAKGGGNVTSAGNGTVTERGICWGTSHNPTTSGSHAASGTGTGSYTANMTNLSPNTKYYVRAYAKNSAGTAYGSEVSFTTQPTPTAPTGAINGLFSVSASQQVYFSQGNLQYRASTNTWRFAEHQWDYVGRANGNISQTYSGWIDLFGWGTSGYNHGATAYQPWSTSTNSSNYYAYGQYTYNLYDQTGRADWGYNAISNGGNTTNTWRTLTHEQWAYVFNTRNTSSGIRYAKAKVNNVNGVILLPDDWNTSYYTLNNANSRGAKYRGNTITANVWENNLGSHGAVFLPAAGRRYGTSVSYVGSNGYYWSASYYDSYYACLVDFDDSDLYAGSRYYRDYGQSVRLVRFSQ